MTNYIELHAHSAYSLLRGTASPEALLAEAARLGLPGLALTDHNNVYGAISFQKAAQALGLQPILGAELTIEPQLAVASQRAQIPLGRGASQASRKPPKPWASGRRAAPIPPPPRREGERSNRLLRIYRGGGRGVGGARAGGGVGTAGG